MGLSLLNIWATSEMMKMQYVHQYVDDSGDLTELFSVDSTE